jgi:hypothetical protein
LQRCVKVLDLVVEIVSEHAAGISRDVEGLKEQIVNAFLSLADQRKLALEQERFNQIEAHFVDYEGFF